MSDSWKAFLSWLYKAPLPAVIGLLIALGTWVVYTQDALHVQQIFQAAQIKALQDVDIQREVALGKIDDKLDRLLEAVLQSRAEQKAVQERLDRALARRERAQDDKAKEGQKP